MKALNKILIIIFLQIFSFSYSQELSTLRKKFYPKVQDTLRLDTLAIVPGSLQVYQRGQPVSEGYYFDWLRALFIPEHRMDSVLFIYRVMSIPAYIYQPKAKVKIIPKFSEIEQEPLPHITFSQSQGLNTEGKITRGVMFGTNSEPSLTSDFSLKMSGNLGHNVKIEAVIADNSFNNQNFEGTYSFQDFDKALINVYFPKSKLIAGDFILKDNLGTFVRYNRQVKGVFFQNHDSTEKIILGAGMQKGLFRRQKFQGQEGNQGPYRLQGENGQKFIMVVPGSEKVYIDGKLKQRGRDKDYVIDYNRAEITFMSRCLITKDSRIVVEFEYWITDFLRTTFFTNFYKKYGSNEYYAGFIRVNDNPAVASTSLSQEQLQLLASIGDSISQALWTTADSVGPDNSQALYCQRDTFWNGQLYKIYVYAQGEPCAVWKVSFSYVGKGKGQYKLREAGTNIRIFDWVGPGNGDYLPVKLLNVPERKQVLTAGANLTLSHGWKTQIEINNGFFDKNLFSQLNDNDNQSINLNLNLSRNFLFHGDSAEFAFNYKFMNKNFPVFDRFLPVEFQRNWNLANITANMHLANFQFSLKSSSLKEKFSLAGLYLPSQYLGSKIDFLLNKNLQNWDINLWVSQNNALSTDSASFFRWRGMIIRKIKHIKAGIFSNGERNKLVADSLLATSFAFYSAGSFIFVGDSTKNYLSLQYKIRNDFSAVMQKFLPSSVANDFTLEAQKISNRFTQLINLTYRTLHTDSITRNLVLYSQTNAQITNSLRLSLNLQSQSGRQPITEFHFIQVPTGTGQYAWIDFNGDGKQQLNEFQLTQFPDQAKYIRLTLPSQTYLKVIDNRLNISLNWQPKQTSKKAWYKLLGFSSNTFNLAFEQKNSSNILPSWNFSDTNVVYNNLLLQNRMNFSPISNLKLSLITSLNSNRNLLLGGFERSDDRNLSLNLKYDFSSSVYLQSTVNTGYEAKQSQLFAQSNFQFFKKGLDIGLGTGSGANTLQINYQLEHKLTETKTSILSNSLKLNLNKMTSKNLRLAMNLIYIYNRVQGDLNDEQAYVLLSGFKPGNNITANITLMYRLMKKLMLNLTYNLRKVQGYRTVHSINFQITGWF